MAVNREDEAINEITPCLWFDTEGEDTAKLYASVFPNSKILDIGR
jgi:predicted 3-demethylubiquinone-9 3-methyltransferase (glyoxalase superfamily)